MDLTKKQRFVAYRLQGYSSREAAEAAGYASKASGEAHELLEAARELRRTDNPRKDELDLEHEKQRLAFELQQTPRKLQALRALRASAEI